MNTPCTRHQASLSLYPPLSPVSDQELLPPCLFQFWALFFFLGNYFPLFITAHLFTSSALSRILRYCHNVRTRFLHVWRNGAFSSVQSPHLNITGLGVPHILHNRATESRVAGFTFRRNTLKIQFLTNLSYMSFRTEYIKIYHFMILTAPVVDPIGLPAMPIPIPLKKLSISRMKLWSAVAGSKSFKIKN